MDISVIIPVYNGEDTLRDCLDALVCAELPENSNTEILVINDGSTDATESIIDDYPDVKKINLDKNRGRIIARKTGAEKARYDKLLFVDSRVKVFNDILIRINEINYQPLLAGGIKHDKYRSEYDTFFYLVRRKIYSPYFPQSSFSKELYIDEKNFFKAPKGTTCFLINKDIFLSSLPDTDTKDTSDDTKIMKAIVFDKKIRILRHTDVKIDYNQRTGDNIKTWIFHRGKIWADYYLSFINRYSILYSLITFMIFYLVITDPFLLILSILLFILAASMYLSENVKDFIIVFKTLPKLSLYFYSGSLIKLFNKSFKSGQNIK